MRNLPMQQPNYHPYPQQSFDYITLPEPDPEPESEKSFGDYLQIIRKRKWTFILPTLVLFPLVAIYISGKRPVYEAKTAILIENANPNITSISEILRDNVTSEYQLTQHQLIQSHDIAEKVVDTLQLHHQPKTNKPFMEQKLSELKGLVSNTVNYVINFLGGQNNQPSPTGITNPLHLEEQNRQFAIAALRESLIVEPRAGTNIVDIKLQSTNPSSAAQQVNMVAQVFSKSNLEKKLDESRTAIAWLKDRAKELNIKISTAENSIQEFKESKQIVAYGDVNQTNNMSMERIDSLQSSYIDVNSERNDLKVRIDEIKKISRKDISRMIGSSSILVDSPAINSLRAEYIRLNNEYQDLSKRFKYRHPKLSRIRVQLQDISNSIYSEVQNLVKTMQRQYDILLAKELNIKSNLKNQRTTFIKSSNDIMTFAKLNNDLSIDKDLYLNISKRLAETTLTEALETNNIKILEPASVPIFPISSSKSKSLLIGLIVTLGAGAGLAVFLESLDKRFKTVEEVEQYLGINFLGIVPSHKTVQNRPITLHDPCSSAAEAYRTLRTWMPISSMEETKALMITSAMPGEGKSTTSANLAISFAQLGNLVVLIDTDLRRPNIHHIFNMSQNSGMVDILAHGSHWQPVLQETEMENLKVIVTGGRPHNPSELLSTRRFQELIESLKQSFDIVIVDAPVTLTIPDVAILAPAMDGVLLVHDPSKGDKGVVLETKSILDRAGAHLLGMIFNNVKPKQQRQYYGPNGYYSYNYTYGQQSSKPRKADSPMIDMRPTENRQKWLVAMQPDPEETNQNV